MTNPLKNMVPDKEPRFHFYRWPHPWGWEWQARFGRFAIWGGLTARWSLAADLAIDGDRLHVHVSLMWLWVSASLWWGN